ncbi:hypothetical protein [Methanolobus chelungpuianus]|uniref:Uncharacterized protein n=1 Tax=Methanolobus chelungpuianus TaxID=502115 RepID=A0AAE3H8K8_9EURY|nr:hypothetical protein [Methanolobus chelungpuianus]MCQ6962177.1 hypothetical protein [Methanolobus chelungpuianus]
MSDAENRNDTVPLKTYDGNELIAKVIEKHKKLLDDYGAQFSEIDGRVRSANERITSSKEKKEHVATRTEVLTEKRQLFYHQAEKVLEEMGSSYGNDPLVQKELKLVAEEFPKLKGTLSPEDEKKHADLIFASISSVHSNLIKARAAVDSFRGRINEAMDANAELASLKNPEENPDQAREDAEKELGELEQKHKWLENRINSHREALAHWERVSVSAPGEAEVKS